MGSALKSVPEESMPVPEGVVAARIDPDNGLRTAASQSSMIEYFYHENMPAEEELVPPEPGVPTPTQPRRPEDIRNEIY
jgi:penicillin-binding protein 1A